MAWIDLVTLFAVIELLAFGFEVGRARARFGVKAPATTGNEIFERYMRVQQNTLELMVLFVPALWIAARYWDQRWIAAIGVVYIVGRFVYFRAYVQNPAKRELGFSLSIAPIALLVLAALIGAVRALLGA